MIAVERLVSGMELAKPVFASDGRVLLRESVKLTDRYIRALRKLGVFYVYIQDAATVDVVVKDSVTPELAQEVLGRIRRVYRQMTDPKAAEQLLRSGTLGREFTQLFTMLFNELLRDDAFIFNMTSIYSSDAYLYKHSMNVGLYACVLGMAHGFSDHKLIQFGTGAMLHDIGKLAISPDILNKPGPLTEEERLEVQRHCEIGYQMLVDQPEIATVSAHCALQHHERVDGLGYPRGLSGRNIHEFGRILAVPDVYDALTSNRVYHRAMLPHEALEYLFANTGTHFDIQFVELFLRNVNIYPIGLPVQCSDGRQGVVARVNIEYLQRPILLVMEEDGHPVKPYELDLAQVLDVTITGCELLEADPRSGLA